MRALLLPLLVAALARRAALAPALLQDASRNPAVTRVITMLGNLASEMETEQQEDERVNAEFKNWCEVQTGNTEQAIKILRAKLEELGASLATLYASKQELTSRVGELTGQVETTKTQIQDAQDKRSQEHDAFVAEQTDFANSIQACAKAVEILKQHYGDGSAPQSTRPAWMSLMEVKKALSKVRLDVPPVVQAFLEQATEHHQQVLQQDQQQAQQQNPGFFGKKPSFHDTYEASTDEGLGIVAQMQVLQQTFTEDKQSAIDEENRLQQAFATLLKEKQDQLQALTAELDAQQASLNAVSQEIGEKETAKANAEHELKDEEAYLASVKEQCGSSAAMFQQRSSDREQERTAVLEAVKVLENSMASMQAVTPAAPAFVQLQVRSKLQFLDPCPQCPRAAAVLKEASRRLQSELLATAAAVTGNAALSDVISALQQLLQRLDGEQKAEEEHKAWCDNELYETNAKKQDHVDKVDELTATIADLKEVIAEKTQAIKDNEAATQKADEQFAEQKHIRAEQKKDAEVEQAHYKDAIAALNEAAQILVKAFPQPALLELSSGSGLEQPQRAAAPQFGAYSSKGDGARNVVTLLQGVAQEFEQGMADAAAMEQQAAQEFQQTTKLYEEARQDLLDNRDSLTAQLQSAQEKLDQDEADLASNQQEVAAADEYLGKLGGSCGALVQHFDARVKLRQEEREAITQAIHVLSTA